MNYDGHISENSYEKYRKEMEQKKYEDIFKFLKIQPMNDAAYIFHYDKEKPSLAIQVIHIERNMTYFTWKAQAPYNYLCQYVIEQLKDMEKKTVDDKIIAFLKEQMEIIDRSHFAASIMDHYKRIEKKNEKI
jgi:hypothetical protein